MNVHCASLTLRPAAPYRSEMPLAVDKEAILYGQKSYASCAVWCRSAVLLGIV